EPLYFAGIVPWERLAPSRMRFHWPGDSLVATCPYCRHPLTAKDLREGWCDACGKRLPAHFLAGAARSAEAAIPVDDAPGGGYAGPTASREDLLGWGSVRSGLGH